MPVSHAFVNPKSNSTDTSITRPSDWNAGHVVNVDLASSEVSGILGASHLPSLAGSYIATNGSSTTSAQIPFAVGSNNFDNVQLDSSATDKHFLVTEGSQALKYDDGSTVAHFYPYYASGSGALLDCTGKCRINVDATTNMLFTASLANFQQPSSFDQTVDIAGKATVNLGTSNVHGGMGGTVAYSVTQTGSSTAGETDLWSVTVPGSTLANNGDSLSFDLSVFAANNANNKQFKIYWGGTVIGDSTLTAAQNGAAHISGIIVRQSSGHSYCSVINHTQTKWTSFVTYTDVSATASSSQIFKVTGTAATANNDVAFRVGKLKWESAP